MRVYFEMSGVKKIGPYEAGKIYEVDHDEGVRLIECKGFQAANDAPAAELTETGEE